MNWFTAWIRKPALTLTAGAVLAVVGLGAGLAAKPSQGPTPSRAVAPLSVRPTVSTTSGTKGMLALEEMEQAMTELTAEVSQSVVQIRTGAAAQMNGDGVPPAGAMPFGPSGVGSGFVYRPDGWIITNEHVVSGQDKVTVVLADGRELEGKVRRSNDPQADIAVVKVEANDLPALPLADSTKVKIGQFAIAVGSPFELRNSVSFGHVSALGRSGMVGDGMQGTRGYNAMIQTDASINPGNSGGPLVNIRGEVIGINTTIYSTSGSNIGIGFALPSNQAHVVADLLIQTGSATRGFLGVQPADLEPFELQKANGRAGAVVKVVTPDGPAAKAGIKEGDVITNIASQPIRGELDLRLEMYKVKAGQEVPVEFYRGSERKSVNVKIEKIPDMPQAQRPQIRPMPRGGDDLVPWGDLPDFLRDRMNPDQRPNRDQNGTPDNGPVRLGVEVGQLDQNARTQFSIPEGVEGVVVMNVRPDSMADGFGMAPGDVIEEIDGTKITTPQSLVDKMKTLKRGERVSVRFSRYEKGVQQKLYVQVPIR